MSDETTADFRLAPVYRAPNENIAQIVRGILESAGIQVILKSMQIPWYDGVMTMGEGYWGDLLVSEDEADRAREIIRAYENG
ncbi:MAG: DUF2007 domain-containing protein [Armatimonadetes bacterium]|nr:DUF2007 domain-containing protein [Armatimonadota bacterium]